MKASILSVTLVSILFTVAGCGTTKVAVKPEATTKVHTIALIEIGEPDAYIAQDFGNPGAMFGAVGGAVAGASSANAGKSVNQVVAHANYQAGAHLTASLEQKLAGLGYRVNRVSVPREQKQKLLERYDSVPATDADAILDVAIESIGYATEHPMFSPHWRPASQVKVALVDSRTGEKLYAEKFMYGYHNPLMSGTDIEAPESYRFKNKAELFADDEKLVSGIQQSVEAVADEVGNNLKK
jgi:hypothetical protein